MTKETKQIQAVYGSNGIADVLEIQESTLRKYCLLLKKSSYEKRKRQSSLLLHLV